MNDRLILLDTQFHRRQSFNAIYSVAGAEPIPAHAGNAVDFIPDRLELHFERLPDEPWELAGHYAIRLAGPQQLKSGVPGVRRVHRTWSANHFDPESTTVPPYVNEALADVQQRLPA